MLEAMILVPAACMAGPLLCEGSSLHGTFSCGPSRRLPPIWCLAILRRSRASRINRCPQRQAPEGRVEADAWGGVTVGFAPAASRVSTNSVPIGHRKSCHRLRSPLLLRRRNKICSSPRRSNGYTSFGHGLPGPLPTRRIYIAWKDVDFGRSGHFQSGCIEGGSILELKRRTKPARKGPAKLVEAQRRRRPLPPQLANSDRQPSSRYGYRPTPTGMAGL